MKFEVKNISISNPKSSFLSHQIESTFKFNNGIKFENDVFVSVVLYVPKNKASFSTEEIESESLKTIERLVSKNKKVIFEFKITTYEYLQLNPKLVFSIDEEIIIN
jgi:hypothetical protein